MWAVLKSDPILDENVRKLLLSSSSEGIVLRIALETWQDNFGDWVSLDPAREQDPRSVLASIYFHAISIYLSGIFDYRHQFNHILSPSLPREDMQRHVREILEQTEVAMQSTNLGGILFFFPLRVAGARARSAEQREAILAMLNGIDERSFVVARAFSEDLKGLWGRDDALSRNP